MIHDAEVASGLPVRPGWLRAAALALFGAGTLFAFLLVAYELALARVPQHRAALERLVRAQTGLDVRFNELGLRWGWYGPEAVFRRVELGEPGSAAVLLRAPELIVAFDAWRMLRSGHPSAGRIELVAPDIDFTRVPRDTRHPVAARGQDAHDKPDPSAILERWRGHVDIEGGTLRLPDTGGSGSAFTLQIRRASLRRSDDDWSVYGLVFLPDRVGQSARVVLRVSGDPGKPQSLSGSLRLEARRLLFGGCRELLGDAEQWLGYLPRGGSGDLSMDLDFEQGRLIKARGNLKATGVLIDAMGIPGALRLDRLNGDWRAARHGRDWRISVDSLQLAAGKSLVSLNIDAAASGRWLRGNIESAPAESVVAVARWLAPHLDLAGVELTGTAHQVVFDWNAARASGEKLRASAQFSDLTLTPQSHTFTLSGLEAHLSGSEARASVDLNSRTATLELATAPQYTLFPVRVASTLQITNDVRGWRISAEELLVEHEHARLTLHGAVHEDSERSPEIVAHGTLVGADVPLVRGLLGRDAAAPFGAVGSRLTTGEIHSAEFDLRGPLGELPFGVRDGFTGSLELRNAAVSGGGLWPDAAGIEARVEWRGPRIQAVIASGRAGAFQLAAARAQWDAAGRGPTRLTGHVSGRLEDALAWLQAHPDLQQYVPNMQELDASGAAAFEFNISVPAAADLPIQARVALLVDGANLRAIAGLPPMEAIRGSVVFDSGHLQRSILSGAWLGGPLTLRLGERREQGSHVLSVQAEGVLNAQQLAGVANVTANVQGSAAWSGDLGYRTADEPPRSHWRMHAESNLLGVMSSLPEPLAKRAVASLPIHIELSGADETAQLRVSVGDRVQAIAALLKRAPLGWSIERGAVAFGAGEPPLPAEPVLAIRGRLSRLDLPAYALAWQRLREDSLPKVRADIVAGELLLGARSYDEVALLATRSASGTELEVDSEGFQGIARWPARSAAEPGSAVSPAELRFARLDLPDGSLPSEGLALIAALAPTARISIDALNWRSHAIGRLTASFTMQKEVAALENVQLVNANHAAHGSLRCTTQRATCHLTFRIDSRDVRATLEDFGFKPELAASAASFGGEVQWQPALEQPWLAGLRGSVSLDLTDGWIVRAASDSGRGIDGRPFALLAVPALVGGLAQSGAAGSPLAPSQNNLRFTRLQADFELHDGQASTSDLHFDGDAEILMHGRTGLIARDYDQQVWVLRGEERLPAAVRQFGATPRVAAVWLSLRDLLGGRSSEDRSRAVLRLQGSWDDPMVVAAR